MAGSNDYIPGQSVVRYYSDWVVYPAFTQIGINHRGEQPHRCPVCGGRGSVAAGFYSASRDSTSTNPLEHCRACAGSGILWG